MPKPKATIKKTRTLFEHIGNITTIDDNLYYENLSDADKKTYNVYMINKVLSMNENFTDLVNEVQIYSSVLEKNHISKIYNQIIPKKKVFIKYIKGKENIKYNNTVIDILKKKYEISSVQAKEYYLIYISNENMKNKLLDIIKSYGIQQKEYNEIFKELNEN